ncbi:hypothetical protein ACFB49_34680 [Sphingomonas sp. DBB INV C78]|uniref:hypothetical protein n=1 Tax=Sphingomonas sp. DBB INV C78 TaxID=3349434 RepID=UPI0036D385D3
MNKEPEAEAFDDAVDFTDPAEDAVQAEMPAAEGEEKAEAGDQPAATPRRKRNPLAGLKNNLPMVIATLGIFTSLIATIGLLVASRNVAEANQRIAALEKVVERAAAAPKVLPAQSHGVPAAVSPTGGAATAQDVRAAFDDFRKDLARYQNMGGNALWVDAIRDGQGELANRLNAIAEKVDRIDRRINGSRPASPAGDRARPS